MPFLSPGADMTRPSRKGGKTSEAKARNASPAKGRKTTKTKSRIAPAATRVKRRSISEDLKETREQQAATAEILKVIADSPDNVQPVFEAIVANADRLIGGFLTAVYRFIDGMCHLVAFTPVNPAADEILKSRFPRAVAGIRHFERAQAGETVEIPDTEIQPDKRLMEIARAHGFRSMLCSPLMSKGTAIGVIGRRDPGSFSAHHVELLRTFSDQAVIAIENVRLFNEVQAKTRDLTEALTYQTGSSNILSVIASSPTDVAPVLKAIVDSAAELCDAYDTAVMLSDGDFLRFSEHHGSIPIGFEKWPINRRWTAGRAFMDRKAVHLRDLLSDEGDDFPDTQELARHQGHRSVLSVPLLRENESIGVISLRRTEVNPFTDKQIALLQTFADQAVIALGNVRLFEEVQQRTRDLTESLEQQTATSEVLEVISASTGELEPVFQKMLENATRVCGAQFGVMSLWDGTHFNFAAGYDVPSAFAAARKNTPIPPIGALAKVIETAKRYLTS
jgi:GAF domain-containing protein